MRVAFLGLGIMGQAMATNLAKAGHEVTVWNRTPGKLVEGAGVAPTPAAAAQGAEVVWLCVSDTAAVEQILFGADGIDQSLAEGMIIADSSTISPSATLRFAERVRAKGVAYVDAPMTGSKIGAANGSLIFMVGGDEAVIDRLNPLFAAMGKKIFRMGDTGKGQATKLAMNLQIALIFEGFAEALTLAEQKALMAPRNGTPGWRQLAQRKLAELDEQIARAQAAREAIRHGLRCPHEDITQCPNFNAGITARLAGQPLSQSHQQLHGQRFHEVPDSF